MYTVYSTSGRVTKKWLLRNEALQRVMVDDGDDEGPEREDLADGLRG